jgi:hypothetical protein
MAGLSPRAHMAALRADRAVDMRRAFGSVLAHAVWDMVCFLSWVEVEYAIGNSRTEKRRDRRKGNARHGISERAAPLIPPRWRLKQRDKLTAATKARQRTHEATATICLKTHSLL